MSNVVYLFSHILKKRKEKMYYDRNKDYLIERGWSVYNEYVVDKRNNIFSVDEAIIIQKDRDELRARYIRLPFYKKLLHVFCDQLR